MAPGIRSAQGLFVFLLGPIRGDVAIVAHRRAVRAGLALPSARF